MLVGGFVVIVGLTWILVAINVRSVISQYDKDHNVMRLYSYLVTLLIMGSVIIGVASAVVQKVIDTENYLALDKATPMAMYRH